MRACYAQTPKAVDAQTAVDHGFSASLPGGTVLIAFTSIENLLSEEPRSCTKPN
jgi:hypothetical protein